jgi:hypothetical protein
LGVKAERGTIEERIFRKEEEKRGNGWFVKCEQGRKEGRAICSTRRIELPNVGQ